MVDICPFKAQERMNDVCKNNYFSPRTKQSYTKLSKLENTNKKKVCRNTRCAFFFFIDYKNRFIFFKLRYFEDFFGLCVRNI